MQRKPLLQPLNPRTYNILNLGSGLGLRGAATDALGFRALQVRRRNPALVIGLCAGGDSGAVGTNNSNLIGRVDLLGAERRLLRALATLAAALLLGEEGGDPGVVDEVGNSAEDAQNNEVQEDARGRVRLRARATNKSVDGERACGQVATAVFVGRG
jgi:hypothetical protein